MNKNFVTPKEAVKILGVHPQTLYKYEKSGLIETIRTPGGKRLYNLDDYLGKLKTTVEDADNKKLKVCYCRVSTPGQKDDLKRQVDFMTDKYPEHEMITDIGSGINFKRKGLQKIIRLAMNNKLDEIVIAYKDRLCRIGYDLIEFIINEFSNAKIVIEHDMKFSPEEEITNDLLQIITVFSARVNGLRSYKKIMQNDISLSKKH